MLCSSYLSCFPFVQIQSGEIEVPVEAQTAQGRRGIGSMLRTSSSLCLLCFFKSSLR